MGRVRRQPGSRYAASSRAPGARPRRASPRTMARLWRQPWKAGGPASARSNDARNPDGGGTGPPRRRSWARASGRNGSARAKPPVPRETRPSEASGGAKCRCRAHQRGTAARIGAARGARFAVALTPTLPGRRETRAALPCRAPRVPRETRWARVEPSLERRAVRAHFQGRRESAPAAPRAAISPGAVPTVVPARNSTARNVSPVAAEILTTVSRTCARNHKHGGVSRHAAKLPRKTPSERRRN